MIANPGCGNLDRKGQPALQVLPERQVLRELRAGPVLPGSPPKMHASIHGAEWSITARDDLANPGCGKWQAASVRRGHPDRRGRTGPLGQPEPRELLGPQEPRGAVEAQLGAAAVLAVPPITCQLASAQVATPIW